MGRRISLFLGIALTFGLAGGAQPAPVKDGQTPPASEQPRELPPGFPGLDVSNLGPTPPPYVPAVEDETDSKKDGTPSQPKRATIPPPSSPVEPLPPPIDPAVGATQALGTPPAGASRPVPRPTPVVADESSPLPPATERAPGSAPEARPASGEPEPAFVLAPEKLPLGRQTVGLTVEVAAPQFLNINQTAALKIVVKNNGSTDAVGVVVRDELPSNLTFVSSQPEAQRIDPALLTWPLGTVAAGSERTITLNVKPNRVGSFDHAATVVVAAGGRSRTIVREPKLKVEQSTPSGKTLRGQPVPFKITVSNPGDGPVRNVTVQAKLSPGLRHESGEPNDQNLFEQTIALINPGDKVVLDTLVAETIQGGEQSCLVVAQSDDVVAGGPDGRSLQTITVVEPKLTLKMSGPDKRYTDTNATYEVVLENPGTAPARNVKIQATIPVSARLTSIPASAKLDAQRQRLTWSRTQLDPGEKTSFTFQVKMGGIGLYQFGGEARAEGGLLAADTIPTDVTGLADVDLEVTEPRRVVDVGDATVYKILIKNRGTKEATRIQLSAVLTDNIKPVNTSGTDERPKFNPAERRVMFPMIERLGPGKSIELGIQVEALKPGPASCRVFLMHDELGEKLDDFAVFKVTPTRR